MNEPCDLSKASGKLDGGKPAPREKDRKKREREEEKKEREKKANITMSGLYPLMHKGSQVVI